MRLVLAFLLVAGAALMLAPESSGQLNVEECSQTGDSLWSGAPGRGSQIIFGRVSIKRPKGSGKISVVVRLRDGRATQQHTLDGSGSYCFEKSNVGGELTLDINGEQVESRSIIPNLEQQREDFRVTLGAEQPAIISGVVSAKFNHKRSRKNERLYARALQSAGQKQSDEAIKDLTAILKDDPADFIAIATLGSVYFHQRKYFEAETWFTRSLAIRPDFDSAWISLARAQHAQNKFDVAIESAKKAIALEPNSAVAFYILGEVYLRTEKGNLAVEALNEAIKLDPVGMAECHLILADLYDLNGAKKLASKEYQAFLAKVPTHQDRQKIEQYVKENPPE